jgi:diguanylate cyclase (GGDEF)-like protein
MDKPRILIIDDDPGLRRTLADILKVKGYETLAAGGGKEGLALLEQSPVNLALIDLGLPDLPGLEVLGRVKTGHPAVEAIILTGNATLDSAIAAANQGAFSYLLKPYDIDQLLLLVRRAIEKQRAEEQIIRHNRELQAINAELKTLYEVSQTLSRSLDLKELATEVLQTMVRAEVFPFELRGAIFLLEEGKMKLTSFIRMSESAVETCQLIQTGRCICGEVAATGEIVISRDAREDGRHVLCHPVTEPHGHIVVPLKAFNKVVGLLNFYTEPGQEVSESILRLLSVLGSQIGIAINNARLYEETRNFSLHDPLTGLANRRFMQIQLEKSFEAAQRYDEALSLIMIDIDHFKRYNDTHGHLEGDRMLARLAQIVLREVRRADYVFRYGGEEFLVLLPETDLTRACEAAERLRQAVEAEAGVTVSLGVAALSGDSPQPEKLIAEADAALYRAKQSGRNRVEAAPCSTPKGF